jgi:two-component system, cell cycle response regulator
LLLPMTHFAGSVSVAERIWNEMAIRSWVPLDEKERVTISMGIALYPSRDVRAKDALLKAAESALHRAKRDGMNRICVFQQDSMIFSPSISPPASPRAGPSAAAPGAAAVAASRSKGRAEP